MKTFLMATASLILLNLNAQEMNTPQETVANLFVATDSQNWELVDVIFNEKVVLDYSSMNGNPAASLSPHDIIAAWKTILPGFEHTHHQIGNFMVTENGGKAAVFCYGTATHYLNDDGGNIWTVVGSYDFELSESEKGNWKINSMKFNFKYQDGNTSLPERAMTKVKKL